MSATGNVEWCDDAITVAVWPRQPGQSWLGAATSFLGMWTVMMVAMMLPCLVPMLGRYRRAVGRTGDWRLAGLTGLVGAAYYFVWTGIGVAALTVDVVLAAVGSRWPSVTSGVPIAAGAVVLIAGMIQFTAWKTHHLTCCRMIPGRGHALRADASTAWRHGLRLGRQCGNSCAGLTAVLLVAGVMDPRVMAMVTAAIIAERLLPAGERIARASGVLIGVAGLVLIARAAELG